MHLHGLRSAIVVIFVNLDVNPIMRLAFRIAVFAGVFFTTAFAAEVPSETMSVALAREVVNKTVELVESRGLYPLQQAEYDQAKSALLAAFDGQPTEIDRTILYARIGKLLGTLDTNGHTFW